jgi:diacylglycerol O-acyltransferase / wax synthase
MRQLSSLDATFLHLETPEQPMHVGALHVFELPTSMRGRFVVSLRKHIQARLPIMPALRRRLWWMPLNMVNPAWVDAEPDLTEHIVEVALPKARGRAPDQEQRALEALVGKLHPVLLDRDRPLWKFHVIEGLRPSSTGLRRVALYTQLHHAAVDGQAAVALANAMLDIGPKPRNIELRPTTRAKVFQLDMTQMLRGVVGGQALKVAQVIKQLPEAAKTLGGAARQAVAASSVATGAATGVKKPSNVSLAPRTPLNVRASQGRAYAAVSLPLAEVRSLAKAHEATVNDVVLYVVSSALRTHYLARQQLPRKSMVAAVPVSLRAKGDTRSDNQASIAVVSLGTHMASPARRLAHIKAASAQMKATMGGIKHILPTDFPSLGLPWLTQAATRVYGRVVDKLPHVANLVVSNVPGPAMPLYMAGARMVSNHPTSIVVHGMALNVTVQSYDQSMDVGLMADAKALPDVHELAQALVLALEDLRTLLRAGDPS